MTSTTSQARLSAAAAQRLIDAAITAATSLDTAMVIAICDVGGHLQAYHRMDGAPLMSCQIAQDKAYTAVGFGRPTHEWLAVIKADPALELGLVHRPRFVIYGGGYPIHQGADLIAGIGVSGGESAEDMQCARDALASCGLAVA
jgi:uncharacterized protein GlcG (DUF336 family)